MYRERIEFSSVTHIQPRPNNSNNNPIHQYDMSNYRMCGYEIIVCLTPPISPVSPPTLSNTTTTDTTDTDDTSNNAPSEVASMSLEQIAGLLTSNGCCIIGGRAGMCMCAVYVDCVCVLCAVYFCGIVYSICSMIDVVVLHMVVYTHTI